MLRTCVQNTYKTGIVKYGMQQFPMNKIATSTQLTTISLQQPLRKKKAEFNLLQDKSALPGSSRWLTTQAETEELKEKQERLKYMVLDEKQQYTKAENEWRIPESESQPPKVIKPFLYLIGISGFSYTLAAYLTIKDASKAMQEAIEVYDQLRDLRSKYGYTDGSILSRWGRTTESDLRIIDRHKAVLRQEERERKVIDRCDILYVPKGIKELLIEANRTISSTFWLLAEASRSSFPILAISTVIFVGFKISRTGILGRKSFTILQKHLVRYPAVDRLHTLTTSTFTHSRFYNFLVNSTILGFLGGAILENNKFWIKPRCTPERTTFYHLLAFCITAGTLASFSSQVYSRVLFYRIKNYYGHQVATKLIGRRAEFGAGGLTSSLLGACYIKLLVISNEKIYSRQPIPKEAETANRLILSLPFMWFAMDIVMMAINIFDRSVITKGNVAARLTGFLFGSTYIVFGIDYWEQLKSFFSKRDQRLQAAIEESIYLKNKRLEVFIKKLREEETLSQKFRTAVQASKRSI